MIRHKLLVGVPREISSSVNIPFLFPSRHALHLLLSSPTVSHSMDFLFVVSRMFLVIPEVLSLYH